LIRSTDLAVIQFKDSHIYSSYSNNVHIEEQNCHNVKGQMTNQWSLLARQGVCLVHKSSWWAFARQFFFSCALAQILLEVFISLIILDFEGKES